MVRKNNNSARSATVVPDALLDEARNRAEAAAARLRDADPLAPGWDDQYAAAAAAARAADRRLAAVEALRAAQVERGGQRAKAAAAAKVELDAMAAALGASRDQVAAAAAEHLRALAGLAGTTAEHNALLARSRARLAELGLRTRDDLVAAPAEHDEGVLDSGQGLRAGGVNWTAIPAPGIAAHALREVFTDGFRGAFQATRFDYRAHEVERRPDGLAVPELAYVGAVRAAAPPQPVMPPRASIADMTTLPGQSAAGRPGAA